MTQNTSLRLGIIIFGTASLALIPACGGSDPGDEPGGGGAGAVAAGGGSGNAPGGGGSPGGGGQAAGGSGAVGAGGGGGIAGQGAGGGGGEAAAGAGGSQGGCDNNVKHATSGNHIVAQVTWPSKTGIEAGSGMVHIWTKSVLDFAAPDPSTGKISATGEVTPCGSQIPVLTKTSIAGGGLVQTVIPDEVWEKPTMPKFQAQGTLSGFGVGANIDMQPVVSLVGLTMSDPNGPWPSSGKQVTAVDHDSDGRPGILAVPRTDPPFQAPPTSLFEALNPSGKRASEVYIVTRTAIQLAGARDSCTSANGDAKVILFDSHVVGCKRNDGQLCSASESDFIDQNQPKFSVQSAVYYMVQLPEGSTCSDVRAAMPP